MGLVLTRWVDQEITLTLDPDADPQEVLDQLQASIRIILRKASGSKASIEILAPKGLRISRKPDAPD